MYYIENLYPTAKTVETFSINYSNDGFREIQLQSISYLVFVSNTMRHSIILSLFRVSFYQKYQRVLFDTNYSTKAFISVIAAEIILAILNTLINTYFLFVTECRETYGYNWRC